MYKLHKQDMKREMGKRQQTDIDINIDMASYQQTKFKKKKMQNPSVEENHVEGTSKKQHLNFQKYICTYKLLMLRRVMVGGIWETPEYLKQNCTSYP